MTKQITKPSHAARFFFPLLLVLSGAVHTQSQPRVQSTAVTKPISDTKVVVKVSESLISAPDEEKLKAFREVIGREPFFRGELQTTTTYTLKGMTFNCAPPSKIAKPDPPPMIERKEWDCVAPIDGWLVKTSEGQREYPAVYARAIKEVFGLEVVAPATAKPEINPITGHAGYQSLTYEFTNWLYPKTNSLWPTTQDPSAFFKEAWVKGSGANNESAGGDVKQNLLTVEATTERAFQQALKRKPTDADIKAVIPVFKKERATFSRMVYILQAMDSLKNIKL